MGGDNGCWKLVSFSIYNRGIHHRNVSTKYHLPDKPGTRTWVPLPPPDPREGNPGITKRRQNVVPSSLWGRLVFQSDGAAASDGGGGKTEIIALRRPADCWKKTVSGQMDPADLTRSLSRKNRKRPKTPSSWDIRGEKISFLVLIYCWEWDI